MGGAFAGPRDNMLGRRTGHSADAGILCYQRVGDSRSVRAGDRRRGRVWARLIDAPSLRLTASVMAGADRHGARDEVTI